MTMPFNQTTNATPTMPTIVSYVDPYVYQTLATVRGKEVVVQTTGGNLRGMVNNVYPDHIVMQVGGAAFFVRIQQIIWVMPS